MKRFTFKHNGKNLKINGNVVFYPKRFLVVIGILLVGFIIWKVWF